MTAEAVSRELLGYCFCKAHGIPCATTPICVFGYSGGLAANRFCFVLKLAGGVRAEASLDRNSLPVSELVSPSADSTIVIGSEVAMVGLNTAWYADQKGRWLAELHFRGGFRGLLNNNVGNDIIQSHPRGGIASFCATSIRSSLFPFRRRHRASSCTRSPCSAWWRL